VALVMSELYQPSDSRLSAKLVPTFVDRGCGMVSTADPYGHNLGFLDRNRYFFFQVAPQLDMTVFKIGSMTITNPYLLIIQYQLSSYSTS
jgi:hypothetical protein